MEVAIPLVEEGVARWVAVSVQTLLENLSAMRYKELIMMEKNVMTAHISVSK